MLEFNLLYAYLHYVWVCMKTFNFISQPATIKEARYGQREDANVMTGRPRIAGGQVRGYIGCVGAGRRSGGRCTWVVAKTIKLFSIVVFSRNIYVAGLCFL